MELLLSIERGDGREPLHAQLERQLRDAIRAGRLAAGERLPPTRRSRPSWASRAGSSSRRTRS